MAKNTIQEIKAGQTGTGLLIEHDGYISMSEGKNKTLMESYKSLNESGDGSFHCPYPFIVDAVFQKFGVENANGRIYPEHILKRQVEIYQKRINERYAYGECYRPDAMILTKSGWKTLKEIELGEEVLTLNTETNEIEIKPVLNIVKRKHEGKMYNIKGRNIDDVVTPEHGYPVYDRNNKFKGFYTAEDIYNDNIPDMSHNYIPKQGYWVGEYDEYMRIPAVDYEYLKRTNISKALKEKYSQDLVIPMEFFAKFMGIYLSEGSHSKKNGYKVNIHQKKQDVCEEIEVMLSAWGIPFTVNESKTGGKTYVISDMRLHKYVSQFGLCYDKYVPYEIKKQPKEILQMFYDWFVMGDGRVRGDKRRKNHHLSNDVFSTSKRMIMDLNEIQLKIGCSGNYHMEEPKDDRKIEDRIILKENSHPLHFTYLSKTKGIYLDKRFISIDEINYNGDVMCVEVENHTWFVMDNNKCHWTKNCNHPSDSTIDLGRIAMNIVELHWEGHTLVGKLEIITSRGFRETGICSTYGDQVANLLLNNLKIGVSSRGLGSVETKMGKLIVQDDYEIICWDVVSDPSTNNAFIKREQDDMSLWVENKETKGNNLLEQLSKIETELL